MAGIPFSLTGGKAPMGIGQLIAPDVIHKRKFRWTFTVTPNCPNLGQAGQVAPWFVKTSGRPKVSLETYELHFLNDRAWIPGKINYETITVTYLDVAANRAESQNLYRWLGAVYNFSDPFNRRMGASVQDYTATCDLVFYDGCGTPLESWTFLDMFPEAINFGDVAYDSNDTVDIELTMRYTKFTYQSHCGNVDFVQCCTGCQ